MKNTETDNGRCPVCGSSGIFSFQSRDLMFDGNEAFRYFICRRCSTEFQSPMPGASRIASFYPDEYDQYAPLEDQKPLSPSKTAVLKYRYGYSHLATPPLPYRLLSRVVALFNYKDALPFIADGRALDVGCGNGSFIRYMNTLGWRCEGVEFNPTAVKVCRQAGLKVFHGELEAAGFPDARFDLVTARQLIEHLPNPAAFAKEVARILKPGGRLVIITPNNLSLGKKLFGKWWFANEVPRHLILFNAGSLSILLEKHGFRRLYSRTSSSPKILLNSWDYLVANRGKPSRKQKVKRLLAKPLSFTAALFARGDILFSVFEKQRFVGQDKNGWPALS